MIRLSNKIIENPLEIPEDRETRNYLYENLEKGYLVFIVPDIITDKEVKKRYKIGFLYDLIGKVYPDYGKEKKHEIINEKYHIWMSYRQFFTQIKLYEKDRRKYLFKKELL